MNRLEVDQAVFYAVAARAWQFVAGPVTVVLIASYFTPELQGYFYMFGSLLAMQTFVELGLHTVIINIASHEWSKLHRDEQGNLAGDPDALARLASLARRGLLWYASITPVFMLAVGAVGPFFFTQDPGDSVAWKLPWFAAVVFAGLSLTLLPLIAVLEGCNQVASVNRIRVVQAVTGNLAVWGAILFGWELWAAVAAIAVKLFWEAGLVFVRFGRFFRSLTAQPTGIQIDWAAEAWPLQWRIALQALFGYFGYSLFTPVMFYYHGPAAGGRMGMTWTVLLSLHAAALAWVQTRAPRFGMLVARRDFQELDRIFYRLTAISFGVVAAGGAAFCAIVYAVNVLGGPVTEWTATFPPIVLLVAERVADRLLPPLPTLLFTLALILLHIPHCQSIYVRAHKVDLFLFLSCSTNITIGLLVWQLGGRFGPLGAGAGYLAVVMFATVPGYWLLWQRCRRELHGRREVVGERRE